MLFSEKALTAKRNHLNEPLRRSELVTGVVTDLLNCKAEIHRVPRVWEPGGGSTLYRVESPGGVYLLKVKHRDCTVESRLETEATWSTVPSLENEHHFLKLLSQLRVPRPIFFEERDGFQFLALEWLTPFKDAVEHLDAVQLLAAWNELRATARRLFERGIVHTDIHEYNVCFRAAQPVLCDFEEARFLVQDVPFNVSLDVAGENHYGNVGEFPEGHGGLPGLTCLHRLERVFRVLVAERLPELLAGCTFDCECPFNLDELQESNDRIYQSVSVGKRRLAGQRPQNDLRHDLFRFLLARMVASGEPVRHLDIGSNLGTFCLAAGRLRGVEESVGVEAFEPYVECARALAFANGARRVRYVTAVCGDDTLTKSVDRTDIVTVLSVYHHIRNRSSFLCDLKVLRPRQVLFELATQDRYYPDSGGLAREMEHIGSELGMGCREVLAVSADYRRPIVLYSREPLAGFDRLFIRLLAGRFRSLGKRLLEIMEKPWLGRENE